jgi:beta-glucanase (GH16 family)
VVCNRTLSPVQLFGLVALIVFSAPIACPSQAGPLSNFPDPSSALSEFTPGTMKNQFGYGGDRGFINLGLQIPYLKKASYQRQVFFSKASGHNLQDLQSIEALSWQLSPGFTFEFGQKLSIRNGFIQNKVQEEFVGFKFSTTNLWRAGNSLRETNRSTIPSSGDKNNTAGISKGFLGLAGSLALIALVNAENKSSANSNSSATSISGSPEPINSDEERPYFVAGSPGDWHMVWNDEFEGSDLDTSKWSMTDMYGRDQGRPVWDLSGPCYNGGGNADQCYTSRPENIFLSNGNLVLRALNEPGFRYTNEAGYEESRNYTSGRIHSRGKGDFTYGRFEASIKLPGEQGSWPAFWMLPSDREYGTWAASGEIDIVESVNLGASAVNCPAPCKDIHGTLHFGGAWPDNRQTQSGTAQINDINAFNSYAVEWYPDEIRWFLNGQQYHSNSRSDWYTRGASSDPNAPFDRDFHLILNLAIGGNWPGALTYPADISGEFPRQMEIEYVRVYQCGGDDPSACKN